MRTITPHRKNRRFSPRRLAGLTLVELLLSLTATSLIGAGAASILFAVAKGTASRGDMRALVVRHKTIDARLSAAVRSSRQVLAIGSNYIVLWMSDANSDGSPNLSEIRRIEFDSATRRLWSYKAPVGVTPDTSFAVSSDFNAMTSNLKGQNNFPGELWANGVTSVTWAANSADTLVSYRLTLKADTLSNIAIGAAALRHP